MNAVEFDLPVGYEDESGAIHRRAVMRRACAVDEVAALEDPRARGSVAYAGLLLLSRVLMRLGEISPVSPAVVERLWVADYAYLREMYSQLNSTGAVLETECPACVTRFELDLLD